MRGELSSDRCATGRLRPDQFFLRLLEAGHRVLQQGHQYAQRFTGAQLSLCLPFVEKASVIEPLVGIGQALKNASRLWTAI